MSVFILELMLLMMRGLVFGTIGLIILGGLLVVIEKIATKLRSRGEVDE